jgi:formylglycine-generating enzyme required for sulfatase activity
MSIITAAQGDQVASWDLKAKHGMFTKHLIDALRGEADKGEYGNGDKKVSLGEVREYLDDRLTRAARRVFGRHQNAWVRGDNSTVLSKVVPGQQVASIVTISKPKVNQTTPYEPDVYASPNGNRPGNTFKDCDECPEMVVIPSGSFMMGSDNGYAKVKPKHKVTIGYSFAVGKFEVTRGEWGAFFNSVPGTVPGWRKSKKRPVTDVSWFEAQRYISMLNKRLSLEKGIGSYRLLSEAEWEYVARAGTTTKYHVGDKISGTQAHFGSGDIEVGSFDANQFGVHDMIGNVSEWTEDCFKMDYRETPVNGSAVKKSKCSMYVLRGRHNWGAVDRHGATPRFGNGGFRLARDLN